MSCAGCRFRCEFGLQGDGRSGHDYVVALAGNPNTGKSTVFNALTGLHQHVGNWPGKTVTRCEGSFRYNGKRYLLVDLPGTYSLHSMAVDEEVARNFLLFGCPDVTVVVVDGTCLERNLNLVLQIFEISDRVAVCLNLMDEAARKGLRIDTRQLSLDLGVPVVPTVANSGKGLSDLVKVIAGVALGEMPTSPHRPTFKPEVNKALDEVVPSTAKVLNGLPNARWVAMRLIEGDSRIREALVNGELASLALQRPSLNGSAILK